MIVILANIYIDFKKLISKAFKLQLIEVNSKYHMLKIKLKSQRHIKLKAFYLQLP